jgi:DNA topoisomerase-1
MILIIAEKNSVAGRISHILGSVSGSKLETKVQSGIRYYSWDDCCCIGLRGHIAKLDFPQKYKNWSSIAPEKLLDAKPDYVVTDKNTLSVLKSLAERCDEIMVATDFDREGELIGKEAVELIGKKVNVKRARFSSLVGSEIKHAFENPVNLDEKLADSAKTRQFIDLFWGAILTRMISLSSHSTGNNFLSVGRVQTPTLAKIVQQDRNIENFKPMPYWKMVCKLKKGDETFCAEHETIWNEEKAKETFERIKDAKEAKVKNFEKRSTTKRRPAPFDTTEFLRCMNYLHISPSRAMGMAEKLYSLGYISYPRTDNTVYPKGLNLKNIVEKLGEIKEVKKFTEFLLKKGINPSRGRTESRDHPPIYPTGIIPKNPGRYEEMIYKMIVRRFLATLYKDAIIEKKNAGFQIKDEEFFANGQKVVERGYLDVWIYERFEEKALPDLVVGEAIKIEKIEMKREETKPPNRLLLGSLIALMQKLGLGTKSTRAEILQKLYDRRYIQGNPPVSTEIANGLINTLEKYSPEITREAMTKALETDMDLMAGGKKRFDEVVEESKAMLKKVTKTIDENREEIGREISRSIKSFSIIGKCKCNKCGGDLRVLTSKKGKRFVACSNYPNCKNSYPLPQTGRIEFIGTCSVCGSPLIVHYHTRRKTKTCINLECRENKMRAPIKTPSSDRQSSQ